MQARADRPHRAVQDVGDLVVAHPLPVDKEERHPKFAWQLGEGRLHVRLRAFARRVRSELLKRGIALRGRLQGLGELGLTSLPPELIDPGVSKDPEQPGPEVRPRLEAGEGLQGPEDGLLHEIVRIRPVSTQEEPGQPNHPFEVREDPPLELGPGGRRPSPGILSAHRDRSR